MHEYYKYIEELNHEIKVLEDAIIYNKKSKQFIISKLQKLKKYIVSKKSEYELKYLRPNEIIFLEKDEKEERYSISNTLSRLITKCDNLITDALSLK